MIPVSLMPGGLKIQSLKFPSGLSQISFYAEGIMSMTIRRYNMLNTLKAPQYLITDEQTKLIHIDIYKQTTSLEFCFQPDASGRA